MSRDYVKSVIISVFFSELISLFLLAFFAFMTYNKPDPSVYSSKLGVVALLIGGLSCGIISSLITGKKNFSVTALSGSTFCILQLLVSFIFSDGKFDIVLIIIKLILTLSICMLVGYTITNKFSKHKKRRRKSKGR